MSVASPRDASIAVMLASFIALPLGLIASSPRTTATAAVAAAAVPAVTTVTGPARSCVPAPLATRAGAVLMVGLPGVTSADDPLAREVTALRVSGIFLASSNARSADQLRSLVSGLRATSPGPLVVSTDAESGRVNALGSLVGSGPSPRRLARQDTPDEVRQLAAQLGARLKSLGVDLDLAPVLDLDDGPYDGVIGDRSFGTDPDITARYGAAFRAGLGVAGVSAAIKHFPGEGGSRGDTHLHPATIDTPLADLLGHDLVPFQREITAGAPVVMVNHLDVTALRPGLPASLAPETYQLLRSMGFTGVAVTDSLGMGAVNSRFDFPAAAVRAIAAGADLAFATDGRQAKRMRDALVAAVQRRQLSEARLDEAATRVARLTGADVTALTCAPA